MCKNNRESMSNSMLSIYNRYDQYNPVEIRNYCRKIFLKISYQKNDNNYKSIIDIDE